MLTEINKSAYKEDYTKDESAPDQDILDFSRHVSRPDNISQSHEEVEITSVVTKDGVDMATPIIKVTTLIASNNAAQTPIVEKEMPFAGNVYDCIFTKK